MEKNNRNAPIAAAVILIGFGLTAFFLPMAGTASAQVACTQIGCVDGLTIDVPLDYRWRPGQYAFEFTLDRKNIRCTGALPLKSCDEHSLTCNADGVTVTESGCALPSDGHGFGTITIASGSASVALTVSRDGQTVAQGNWTPDYRILRPNGPLCEPVCRQATVTLKLH